MQDILIIDHNPLDLALTMRALRDSKINGRSTVIKDGAMALAHLFRKEAGESCPLPKLIILEVQLPVVDGFEVLRRLRADKHTQQVPVVVLTSSHADQPMANSLLFGADRFVRKPDDCVEYISLVRDTVQELYTNNYAISVRVDDRQRH